MADQNFSAALVTWKEINLSELQKSLDKTAVEVVENQKENLVGRKKLAEQTREFKKSPDDTEKFAAIKILLKAYQGEIDSLTRRSKISETSFLNVYKLLADAPDPYPLLNVAVDQTVKVAEARMLESEVTRLRDENADLKKSLGEMFSLKDKKKKADAKVEQLEKKMDDLIQERVNQKEIELNAEYDERMRNYEEREKDLQRQVETVKQQLRNLHTSNESAEAKLLDASQRQGTFLVYVAARLAELDMVAADLARANERVASVERRNEQLRSEVESVRSGSQQSAKIGALETQISELEAEASRILSALDMAKETQQQTERQLSKQAEDSAKEVESLKKEIDISKEKMKEFADYDEVKRELEIMKYVEFSGADFGDDEDSDAESTLHLPNPNASVSNKKQARSLENLLVSKNRRLLEDLTKVRISWEELSGEHVKAEEIIESLQADLAKQRELVEKLEVDLISLNHREDRSGTGTPGQGLAGLDIGVKADGHTPPTQTSSIQDTSILPIVTSQRDRFRQRNAELEQELRKQSDTISNLRAEVKSLQADNLKLYEKVRYIGSYRDSSTSEPHNHPHPTTHIRGSLLNGVLGRRDDEIGKYKDKYDESLNPFESFKSREAQRAVHALNPLERGVFSLTRAIVGNKRARNAFIVYAGSLHILILFVLWNSMAPSDSNSHSPVTIHP
nr:homeobox protein cut-like [Cryptococcus depauperatus CBS 7855]